MVGSFIFFNHNEEKERPELISLSLLLPLSQAMICHPDKNPEDPVGADLKFKEVSHA